MEVSLLGLGSGGAGGLTAEAAAALAQADCILGARRLLDGLPDGCTAHRVAATRAEEILQALLSDTAHCPCVVYSGDTGFYSGATGLLPLLRERGIDGKIFPGLSSLQLLAARLGRPWQDWKLVSAHGVACDPAAELGDGSPVFFLTGGEWTVRRLCAAIAEAGLPALAVTAGERLSYPDEKISTGTALDFSAQDFAPLSVLLIEAAPRLLPRRTPGLPDGLFLRGEIPMTKQEVRAAALSKLAICPGDICWDIGAGTGSVSVELALQAKAVYGIECRAEALALAEENKKKFGVWNLHLSLGKAPAALVDLPVPDAVFVGGSGGELAEILQWVSASHPAARLCVSALALETLSTATETLTALGYETEVTQIAVSRTRTAGALHLLLAQNPVFLITGVRA
ncbi:MAG: precorrin-6y C5,15-methyltransferase (decarboxylating) subunit CbiE [Oscillospiraceae bacterium]